MFILPTYFCWTKMNSNKIWQKIGPAIVRSAEPVPLALPICWVSAISLRILCLRQLYYGTNNQFACMQLMKCGKLILHFSPLLVGFILGDDIKKEYTVKQVQLVLQYICTCTVVKLREELHVSTLSRGVQYTTTWLLYKCKTVLLVSILVHPSKKWTFQVQFVKMTQKCEDIFKKR